VELIVTPEAAITLKDAEPAARIPIVAPVAKVSP
jgi:hypothetical protein